LAGRNSDLINAYSLMWVRTFALKAYTAAVIRGIAAIHAPAAIRSVMMKVVETVGFLTLIAFKSKFCHL
jgi:hypothetical protein